jgi:uncharacterized repeat protein (TIGR01451 family)
MVRAKSLVRSLPAKLVAAGAAVLLLFVMFAGPALAANGNDGLQLDKTASPNPATEGKRVTFTITDQNTNSDVTLSNVNITDNLPSGFDLRSATATGPNGAVVCSTQDNDVSCGPFTLGPGDTATVNIVATPTTTGNIRNRATDNAGNTASVLVTVSAAGSGHQHRHHHRH